MMSSAVATPAPLPSVPVQPATPLDAKTMQCLMQEGAASHGDEAWRVQVVETTGSTNSDLLAAIRAHGYEAPTLLVARHQTAGRGRLGRVWTSAADASLAASFALRLERPMSALDGVTLACGMAACDAVLRHGVDARLKWPNDLLVDGRKLAGILVEVLPAAEGTVLVVGIGINVGSSEHLPDGTGSGLPATDLRAAGGGIADRNRLAADLGLALQRRLAAFATGGFASCMAEWNHRDAFRDQAVVLRAGADERVTGIARGVDATGALLIDTADGRRRIVSGDLSLRLATAR